jgi:hypothetical protein
MKSFDNLVGLNIPDGELTGIAALDNPFSVILSPAPGDLNADNTMLWLNT